MTFNPLTQKLSKNDNLRLQSGKLIIDNRHGCKRFWGRIFHKGQYNQSAIITALQNVYNEAVPKDLDQLATFKTNYENVKKKFKTRNEEIKKSSCISRLFIKAFFGKTAAIKDDSFSKKLSRKHQNLTKKELSSIGDADTIAEFLKTENLNANKNSLQTYIDYFKYYSKSPASVKPQLKLVTKNLSEALNFHLKEIADKPLDELQDIKDQLSDLKEVLEKLNTDAKVQPLLKQLNSVISALEIKEETTDFSKEFTECIEGFEGAYGDPNSTIFDALSALGELGIDKLENLLNLVNTYSLAEKPLTLPKKAVDYEKVLEDIGLLKIADYQKKKIFSKQDFCNYIADNVGTIRKKLQKHLTE